MLDSGLDRPKPERTADAGHDEGAVAAGEHALQVRTVDLDTGKARPARCELSGGCPFGPSRER